MSPGRLPTLQAGVYQHYKGHHYQVLGLATDSTNDVRGALRVVVYLGLQLDDDPDRVRMHVREEGEFHQWVHGYVRGPWSGLGDGSPCTDQDRPEDEVWCEEHDMPLQRRFEYVGAGVPV